MPVSLPRFAARTTRQESPPSPKQVKEPVSHPQHIPGKIVIHPRYARFLRRIGLDTPQAILELPGEILCGHPDRNVARIVLPPERGNRVVFLKREHHVATRIRFKNLLAGFGWVSRSEREALILRELEDANLPGPQWLAYGEDNCGRAFLLVDELVGMSELRELLQSCGSTTADRFELIARLSQSIAELHDSGFSIPELAAKHVFVDPQSFAVTLIDWQSASRCQDVNAHDRIHQLAELHASLAPELASNRDRLWFLKQYLKSIQHNPQFPTKFSTLVRAISQQTEHLVNRSSNRDQRQRHVTNNPQRLIWLANEAVCVVPEIAEMWPKPAICEPFYPSQPDLYSQQISEERIRFPDGRDAVLIRANSLEPIGRMIATIREKPWRSVGTHCARILFHLHRYGIASPKLLAFGQRACSAFRSESFVVFEASDATKPIAAHYAEIAHNLPMRNSFLVSCGDFLRTLHDAGCCLNWSFDGPILNVDSSKVISVSSPLAIRLVKKPKQTDRMNDLQQLFSRVFKDLSRAEQCRILRAYLGESWKNRKTRRSWFRSLNR